MGEVVEDAVPVARGERIHEAPDEGADSVVGAQRQPGEQAKEEFQGRAGL